MRILFITNYYPPSNNGWGYMQLCEEVADGLHALGHEVAVLTSTYCDGAEIKRPYPVYRWLQLEPDWDHDAFAPQQFFVGRRQREADAIEMTNQLIAEFTPDVASVWHAIGIPKAILKRTEDLLNGRVAYYLADYQPEISDEYLNYWGGKPTNPLAKILKKPIASFAENTLRKEGKPIQLAYEHVACVSGYVRDRLVKQKLISDNSVVIHNGVDLTHFDIKLRQHAPQLDKVRCLVAGRLVAEKGIHTVVDAFGQLDKMLLANTQLSILGGGDEAYIQMLKQKVETYQLQEVITFLTPIPRDHMPQMLASHDLLIFSSEYDEPLARAMQEAMALGMLVVGTTTGGSGELLVHNETGLVYQAGDPAQLAKQLQIALSDSDLFERLATNGYQTVRDEFDINHTVTRMETFLRNTLPSEMMV